MAIVLLSFFITALLLTLIVTLLFKAGKAKVACGFSESACLTFLFKLGLVMFFISLAVSVIILAFYIKAAYGTYMFNLIKGSNIPVDSWFYLGGS
jgi:hypothetical protein